MVDVGCDGKVSQGFLDPFGVSILVVVDVGCDVLGECYVMNPGEVSILVVVDVGCDASLESCCGKTASSFNPCCGGCRM
mgnify:CR=1 FL=1